MDNLEEITRGLGDALWAARQWPVASGKAHKDGGRAQPANRALSAMLIHPFVLWLETIQNCKSISQSALTETASGPSIGLNPCFWGAYNLITVIRGQLTIKLCDTK